ncbi:SurA N-terminal domain-containing protein [Geoalkalibacter sp.]|uniref:SurA N-terminal domain-containing protein n=1 Tax=Geoalkalibacter sp. TaxID=3041440 RepID=UPI00272E73DA|nr:SurA N-terminal domain-containing protein [Geoalkalibacter sp.]
MLDFIRKKQKTLLVKLVFWTIIAAFVGTIFLVWGKGSDSVQDPAATALVINGEKLSLDAFQRTYGNLYNLYQSLYRDQFTPQMERSLGLRQMAADRLTEQTLLAQEAKRRGIKVTRDELVASIAEITAFHEDGVFSRQRYLQVLNYQRITPEEFEASQQRQLLINKVIDDIQKNVAVTDEEIETAFRDRNEEVNLSFVTFAPALYENRVQVDDAQLREWFAQRQEDFRQAEAVALRYVEFTPSRYRDQVRFDDAEIERHYRRHLDQFEVREQIQASHILIRVAEDADEQSLAPRLERAQKVLADLKAGKDFAELARLYSDDEASAVKGGDLGYFPRGVMVPAFEQTAFALRPGELSELVRTPFGFHIIKVTGYIEAGIRPMEDVIEQVKNGLRDDKARQLATEKAMDAYNLNRRDGDLDAAARANDLGIKETGFFTRGGAIDGIGESAEITDAAFALNPGELARPVVLPQGVFLFTVKEKRPSRLPDFDEVRAEAEAAYRREESVELARQAAEEFLAALGENGSLEARARKENLKVEETGLFSRAFDTFIPRLGNDANLFNAAFALEAPGARAHEVYSVAGKFVLVALKERKQADMSTLDAARREEIRTSLLATKQQEVLEKEVAALRQAAKVQITPALANFLER